MNKSHPTTHSQSITDADRDQCLRYLLGELNSSQTAAFESRLAESPELTTALIEHSEAICQVAQADIPQTTSNADSRSQPWIEALVAIAACLAVGFFAWNSNSVQSTIVQPIGTIAAVDQAPSEQSLIAQAWASTSQQAADSVTLDIENEWESIEEVDGSSLSWVMAAVESGVSIDG